MRKLVITVIISVLAAMTATASGYSLNVGENIKINSKVLDEERELMIYLPKSYTYSDKEYPVVYLLDGETHFFHVSGMLQFLSGSGKIPEMILVGVKNTNRKRDMSPTAIKNIPESGGAAKFIECLKKDIKNHIDKKYRTSGYNILVGHSFAGAFSLYYLTEKPGTFNAYVSLSPYLMFDKEYLISNFEKKMKSEYKNTILYMSMGDETAFKKSLDKFDNIIKNNNIKGLNYKYVINESEDHITIAHSGFYSAFKYIFKGYAVDGNIYKTNLATLDNHYKDFSEKTGFDFKTPENDINLLAYNKLLSGDTATALEIFKENIKRFPESANVYDSYGEALERTGKLKLAAEQYLKAVELADKNSHPAIEVYAENIHRLKKHLY